MHGPGPVEREGKVTWINKEQKAVNWDRKRYHKLLSKKEAAAPIKSPICCAAFSHQEGLPGMKPSCEDVLLIAERFGFDLCFVVASPEIMQRWEVGVQRAWEALTPHVTRHPH